MLGICKRNRHWFANTEKEISTEFGVDGMKWKKRLKDYLKTVYASILQTVEYILGIDAVKKLDVFLRFGKRLNLKNPQTLADKACYIALHCLPELAARCTDKWEVRKYIASKGLEEILIPVYGNAVYKAEDVDFDLFPDQFVLKATHGCAMNYICKEKSAFNKKDCLAVMNRWLNTTYGTFSVEPHYRKIPHRIYCEKYLADAEELMDYKIHCIHGQPDFILVCSGRKAGAVTLDVFDLEWKWLDVVQPYQGHVPGSGIVPKPQTLEYMIQIARILSEDFAFVRVDLYEVNGTVYFGELTFTPTGCLGTYYTDEAELKLGEALHV